MPSAFAFGAFAAPVGFAGAATATDAFVMSMSVWKPESAGSNGGRERCRGQSPAVGETGNESCAFAKKPREKSRRRRRGDPEGVARGRCRPSPRSFGARSEL